MSVFDELGTLIKNAKSKREAVQEVVSDLTAQADKLREFERSTITLSGEPNKPSLQVLQISSTGVDLTRIQRTTSSVYDFYDVWLKALVELRAKFDGLTVNEKDQAVKIYEELITDKTLLGRDISERY